MSLYSTTSSRAGGSAPGEVSTAADGNRRVAFLWAAALLVFCVAVYSGVLGFQFLAWDDGTNIYRNPAYNPPTFASCAQFWIKPYFAAYIPVTRAVWGVIAALSRHPVHQVDVIAAPLSLAKAAFDPRPFHAANLVVHCLNSLLVFALLIRLLRYAPGEEHPGTVDARPRDGWALLAGAAGGALLFAVHPLQVEPVSWITGMKDLLSSFFCLSGLLAYARAEAARRRGAPLALAALCYLLALCSKPSMASVPIVIWALNALWWRRPWRLYASELAASVVMAIPFVLITHRAEAAGSPEVHVPLLERPFVAADALRFYFEKLIWPSGLIPDYGRTPAVAAHTFWFWPSGLLVMALLLWLWRRRRIFPVLTAGTALWVGFLAPVLGFTTFAYQSYSTVADRYSYLALLGPALVCAAALRRWLPAPAVAGKPDGPGRFSWGNESDGSRRSGRVAVALGAVLWFAGLAMAATLQTSLWADDEILCRGTLDVNPVSGMAFNNYGLWLQDRGRLDDAEACYRSALAQNADDADVLNNLGGLLLLRNRPGAAVGPLQRSVLNDPANLAAWGNLGNALESSGQLPAAVRAYRSALAIGPSVGLENSLGRVLAMEGRDGEAEIAWRTAIAMDPGQVEARFNLGILCMHLGRKPEALNLWEQALAVASPNSPLVPQLKGLLAKGTTG